ncbi:MAG: tRNA pseudouridine(55) synthase TruB [Bacteroidales bacterium]|nr:tRNA pseudouridine(55) synthase TruB [Bacteroidota bacterium]MBL6949068.1 tRNA pseudouridine(55) synthase TruB [Bacteroidales bacterium]
MCLPSTYNFLEGEMLLINKPFKWTSFDVVNNLRYFLKSKMGMKKMKIGHTGTLDPLATGLLILCTGRFTKRIEEFKNFEKEYTGTFIMGATTPSFDRESEIDHKFTADHLTEQMILNASNQFKGDLMQVPPAFSAVWVKGRRAYDYARQAEEVNLDSRTVNIVEFEIDSITMPEVHFRIVCSKGTYIRALARDFGKALKTGAYLGALCRTRIGPYHLRDAYELEDLKQRITDIR